MFSTTSTECSATGERPKGYEHTGRRSAMTKRRILISSTVYSWAAWPVSIANDATGREKTHPACIASMIIRDSLMQCVITCAIRGNSVGNSPKNIVRSALRHCRSQVNFTWMVKHRNIQPSVSTVSRPVSLYPSKKSGQK